MKGRLLDQIVEAVLYEGYILYPYRASSKKNHRERFTFGRVYPEAYSRAEHGAEPCMMQTECLIEAGSSAATVDICVRFLHPMAREVQAPESGGGPGEQSFQLVPELRVDGQLFQTWHEAVEREFRLPGAIPLVPRSPNGPACGPLRANFCFPAEVTTELIRNQQGRVAGHVVRRQEAVSGAVEVSQAMVAEGVWKMTVRILNQTPVPEILLRDSEAVLLRTFASTHTVLSVQGGEFISLMGPQPGREALADACKNIGAWPVLVGDEDKHERDTMLSSPIILYDYPKIAPESAGPLFDGTEIDEILTLRILTLTENEKLEMRRVDEQARRLLERTEALDGEALLKMHGTLREQAGPEPASAVEFDDFFGASTPLTGVWAGGVYLQRGDRVRIRPKARADLIDAALAGQAAIIEAVEQDMEGRIHLAVVMEKDPGKDLGLLRQPGHRFFYGVDEVEPLPAEETEETRKIQTGTR